MITKERLKELIKQGATIYGVICDDYYYEEVLDKKYYISSFDDKTSLHKKGYGFIDYLENLYESKEEAEIEEECRIYVEQNITENDINDYIRFLEYGEKWGWD